MYITIALQTTSEKMIL